MGSTPLHSSALFPSSAHTPDCRPAPASSGRGHTVVAFDLPHSDHMFSTRDRACGDKLDMQGGKSTKCIGHNVKAGVSSSRGGKRGERGKRNEE
jgi:hypothetical protein